MESASKLGDLEQAVKLVNLGYSDALADWQNDLIIQKNKDRETITSQSTKGISLRAFTKNGWAYMNSNKTDLPTIRKSAQRLNRKRATSIEGKLNLPDPITFEKETPVKKRPGDVSLEEKLQRIRELFKLTKEVDERIVDVQVRYSERLIRRSLATSHGTSASQTIPRTRIGMDIIVREDDATDHDLISQGGTVGYEVTDEINEQMVRNAVAAAVEQLKAVPAPTGLQKVIVDPGMVGTMCHESFGHGLEADQAIRGRSYLKDMIGKKVASDLVTIHEDSSLEGGHGTYFFDDDGALSRKNTLVERGTLVSFLHDIETSAAMNASLTASSRTQNAARRRFIRMSNTYSKPGDWSTEDMVKDTKNGVIVMRWLYGIEDPLGGGMQVSAKKGYLIENGQKTKPLKSITLTGRVLEVLGAVDAVSKEGFMTDPGNCGKGHEDLVPVGGGGTWWRTTAVIA